MSSILETLTQALEHHQAGRGREAETIYRQVLAQDPRNADALHLLGMLAYEAGQLERATACLAEAIYITPWIAPFHNNLGRVLEARGEMEDALLCFEQALRLDPDHAEAHVNLGNTLQRLGLLEEAIAEYRQGLELRPSCAEAHNNLGNALRTRGQLEEALACFKRALALKPEYAEAWLNRGNVLRDQEHLEEAERSCREALRCNPELAEGHSNLGAILHLEERLEEAEGCCREALRRKPGLSDALANLGAILLQQQRRDEAEACCRQALEGNPDHPEAWNNLGSVLSVQQRFEEAAASYRRAIEGKPASANAHWNLALVLLRLGDFEAGWREYEWRWKRRQTPPRSFQQPPWDGSPLGGRTILLHSEQGLEDTIQFIRYAPLVKQSGGSVVVECQAALARLLEGARGIDQLVAAGSLLPEFDVHAPLLSLPLLLGTTVETIPRQAHYLEVRPEMVERWRQRISSDGRFKVGLAWAGNATHPNDQNRAFTPDQFAPLEGIPGVAFFSLQEGPQAGQLSAAPPGLEITPLDEESRQITDTAAIILNLDLVITVDTLAAHLAGALGKPVWTLLSFVADWRWLLDREDSPWYPTMRLFRQPRPGDWKAVMERAREALEHDQRR